MLTEHPLISLHDKLVGAGDGVHFIGVVELAADITAKKVPGAARAEAPAFNLFGVRPEEVAHGAVMRDFLLSIDCANLVEGLDAGGKAAVDAEDSVVDDGGEGDVIEDVGAVLPHVDASVFPQALVVKAVHLRDLPALVIAPYEEDPIGVSDFECQEQEERLHAVKPSVDKISQEQVVCPRTIPSHIEQFLQVIELPVYVAADCHGRLDALDIRLLNKDLHRFPAERLHLRLPWRLATPKPLYHSVKVERPGAPSLLPLGLLFALN